jgi:hypothetical protein
MRYQNPNQPQKPESVGLPLRPFLYTLDQVATLLEISEYELTKNHIHLDRVSVGVCPKKKMIARNVAPDGDKPDWRVAERDLIRWMKYKGFRYYEKGWFTH